MSSELANEVKTDVKTGAKKWIKIYTLEDYKNHGFISSYCGRCGEGSVLRWYLCWGKFDTLYKLAFAGYDEIQSDIVKPAKTSVCQFTTSTGKIVHKEIELSDEEYIEEIKHYIEKYMGEHLDVVKHEVDMWLKGAIQSTSGKDAWISSFMLGYEYTFHGRLGPNGGVLPLSSGYIFKIPSPATLLGLIYMYPGFTLGLPGSPHRHGN
jgi:hypothetical protein